ncbi:MAG: NAD(P)H-dependent oxidoreductase [Armatimonadota bacterium]|nr:NAD(P)H-dependent oxidoreductase [Armatimonadota bacterium]MCX7778223.1 NAD(P)H-dependent oxidoreductase [Armatimonadota bacterium]MDW8024489.1 NAD(P)H-dependent oxidoreductase [Armatimonadota bacterium]
MLVVYYSRTGNTQAMAEAVAEGVRNVPGVKVELKRVEECTIEDLLRADGIIVGSPTYYGLPASEIKRLFDESVRYHGQLEGKVGGAFSSSANVGGGNETTVLGILQMMLIHGMIVQGAVQGDHYGPVSIGFPDARSRSQCFALGERIAKLVLKLFGED